MALAQVLADAYGPVGRVEEMPAEERQTFLDMADAAIEHFGKQDRLNSVEANVSTCLVCGHEWERHDPEDGRCDAYAVDGSGVCQCGRDLAFHQKWNAYLSRMALGRLRSPRE